MVKRPERTSFCSGRFDQTALFNPRAAVACVSCRKRRADSNRSRPFLDHQSFSFAGAMLFAMMRPAKRDREFIADLKNTCAPCVPEEVQVRH